jgi:glycerol-3-phosphate acyltransferase PlsY
MMALCLLAGYLLGSIPFGVLIARARGVDLRAVGSGNIGATNAARALGKRWGVLVLVLDAGKAALPILLFRAFTGGGQALCEVAIGAGAFVGHLFPLYLRFRGGKGVATAFGAFLGLQPLCALLGLLTWAVAYGVSRISSVGSLCAVLLFPLWLWLLGAPPVHFGFAGFLLVLILIRHRGNIRRLWRHQEGRI